MAATILAGCLAPLRHPLGFLACSLPWLLATVALNRDLALDRRYTPFLGACCQGWHYDAGAGLYVLQAGALLLFAVAWMHLLHTGRVLPRDFDLARLGPRVGHLALALLVVALLLIVAFALFFLLGYSAWAADSDWWWSGGAIQLKIACGLALGWFASHMVLYLPSAAMADEPLGLADAWDRTRGQGLWILATFAPVPLSIAAIKAMLLAGLADRPLGTALALVLDLAPLWARAPEIDPVPPWLLGVSIVLAWLQIGCLCATMALLYGRLCGGKGR